jgi:hypothetical protein
MLEERLDCIGHNKGLLLAFLCGFVVRLIPELLSYPNPIGWDTIYYAYRIEDGVLFGYWDNIFSSWMIYAILMFLNDLTHLSPFLLLKVVAPLLYGGVSAGVYFVASKKFGWSITKSLMACLVLIFSVAGLAISWQFYRNVFGVIVFLFAIPLIKNDINWKETMVLSVLSLLIAWGHELSTISFFFVVLGYLLLSVVKKEKIHYRLFVALIPAFLVFFGNFLWISPHAIQFPTNLVWLDDSVWAHPANLFFLTDYLRVNTPIETYSSYFDLFSQVGSLFVLLYMVLLPLVAVGYFKDRTLNLWTLLLLVGAFGCLIVPFAALLLWARWMLMLIVPFTYFAANGLWKITKSLEGISVSRWLAWPKITKKVGYALLLILIILGTIFMTFPLIDGKSGLLSWSGTFKYFPSTMQSSSIPLRDIEPVTEAYEWLNNNMNKDSSLLVHDTFEFWTLLYLKRSHSAILFDNNLQVALDYAQSKGYQTIYIIWWNQDIGGYNLDLTEDWVSVQNYKRISIYENQ